MKHNKTRIQVMLSPGQASDIKREAMKRQLSVSSYVRTLLNNQDHDRITEQ